MADNTEQGRELHREFVGMLFALAIAQVAVQSADVINHDLDAWIKAPALSHLLLAAIVIATSWVGWGRSGHSLSPVRHVFTKDFVELLIDVGLVGVYFFIVQGAEKVVIVDGAETIQASAAHEALWVMVMFAMYLLWDIFTKWGLWKDLGQKIWGSILCAGLAWWAFCAIQGLRGTVPVLWGDLSLLCLVLLFRATKLRDLFQHTRGTWAGIICLTIAWGASTLVAVRTSIP